MKGCQGQGAVYTGPSDLNVILGVITNFLDKPYNSIEDPLDLWFHNLPAGSEIPAFSIGYSVGMAKSLAAISILHAVQQLEANGAFSEEEFVMIGDEIQALLSMKAMTEPGATIEEQVLKSISKKFRVTDRPRPHVIQLHIAFDKVVQYKRSTGDKRPDSFLLALAIKEFNQKQSPKNRVTTEEREAILNLRAQTVEFRNLLADHWQSFPVCHSAVPVSLLAKPWHSDTYEPVVKKSTHPRMYEALTGSKEKREMWLKRVIGKYMKNLRDMRTSGKTINIRSVGQLLRKEPDDEMVRHCACLFTAWLPQFRSSVSPASLDELIERFVRSSLDRELTEKVKSADESLTISDWRFITTTSDYVAKNPHVDEKMEDVLSEKLAADLRWDLSLLTKEQRIWSTYLTNHRLFTANTHNAKVEEREAVSACWQTIADDHLKVFYPIVHLKKLQDIPSAVTTMIENYAERSGVPKHLLFKVFLINLTYLGSAHEKRVTDFVALVRDRLLNDPERTCAVFVAPNTGPYRQTYDEGAAEKARRDLLDRLREDANEFAVSDVSVFFDPNSMWSKTRRIKHELYMCISSRRDEKGKYKSEFAKSWLFVKQSFATWVACHPRHEFVDPTIRINTDRGNLSQMREHMQWVTGDNFYATLCRDMWSSMQASCQDGACWIDLCGYDHFPASAILARAGSQDAHAPKEMCGTIVHGYSNNEGKQVEAFLEQRVAALLRSKCERKQYVLPGAPDLSAAVDSKNVFVKPTYNEQEFVITKPLADESLPLRQAVVQKWSSSGVPVLLKDRFTAELVAHNSTYNKSGKGWEQAATGKRQAPAPAEGSDAVEARPTEQDPKSIDEITKLHEKVCEKAFESESVKFITSSTGDVYVVALEDTVFPCMKPLVCLAGEYLVGQQFDAATNEGCDMLPWQMSSDEFEASFSVEPPLQTPFTSDIVPLHSFLHFLESQGKVNVKIECHTYKRLTTTAVDSASGRQSSYNVSASEKCGFRTGRPRAADKIPVFAGVTPAAVKDSQYLKMVMRLKFVGDQKIIQPQRPGVYFKKSMRFRKGSIIKLL